MRLLPVWLNLDACSIIRLATLVLALAITTYLLSRRGKSRATLFLGLAFCGAAVFDLSSLLEFSGRYYWQARNLKNLVVPLLQEFGPWLALISLLLFAYFFPRLPQRQRGEARVVVGSMLIVATGMLALGVFTHLFLERRLSRFDFTMTYYILLYASFAVAVVLLVLLLLRRAVSLSGPKSRPWWVRLARPAGRHAATARALALNMLLPGAAVLGYVLMTYGLLPPVPATYLVWLAFLLFHFSFLVTYLNRAAEATTFQVKLIGLTLIPVLALLGLAAVLVGAYTGADYASRHVVANQKTLRFIPNDSASYDIEEASYRMDMEPGSRLEVGPQGMVSVDMQFIFPFFRRPFRRVHVLHSPMIYLGERLEEIGWGGYRPNPAIAPVIMNLDPSRGGGVFAKSRPQSLTLTWLALPELGLSNENTVQLVLERDGSFTMSLQVDPQGRYPSVQMYNFTTATTTGRHPGSRGAAAAFGARLTGIHPGGQAPLRALSFSRDLPYSSPAPEVIFESYEAGYAGYLHDRMALLAVILLFSALLILFLFPLLFQANLIRPLRALADGMGRADAGDLDAKVRPRFGDEIGFLTRCFNRMLHSIKKHEAGLRTVAESIQEGMLILRDGVPVYVNRRMYEITGWTREDLENPESLGLPGPQIGPTEAGGEGQPVEALLVSKANTGVPVELTRAETLWHGKPAVVIVVRDVSRRKSEEERARQRDQRLMQTNKLTTMGVLLSAMAHQLTTPSQSILHDVSVLNKACPGLASILERLGPESAELLIAGLVVPEFCRTLPKILGEIDRNARRIEGIITELRSFGREDPFPILSSMDMNAVLRSAVELTSGQLKRATESFSIELAPELPPVRGSARLMEQVVANLLLNACQALTNPAQGIVLRSRSGADGGSVLVEVEDHGVGIATENIERIGERFFTTRRASGGTGLGVYIAKNILERHGGSLAFTSERGGGTLAVVTLPAEGP